MALYRGLPKKAPDTLPDGTPRPRGKFEGVNLEIPGNSLVTEATWGDCVRGIGGDLTDCLSSTRK